MSQVQQLHSAVKQVLKNRGMTYAQLARGLRISESSVKRLLSRGGLTLERLEQICNLLETDFSELAKRVEKEQVQVQELTLQQETELADDPHLLAVAYHLLNDWTPARIRKTYAVTDAALTGLLTKLDRLRLIELLPNNRVKVLIGKNLKWRPNGPLRRRYTAQALAEFFDAAFLGRGERLRFLARELSFTSVALLQRKLDKLDKLAAEFEDLAELDQGVPAEDRTNVGVVLALRPWIFSALASLNLPPEKPKRH